MNASRSLFTLFIAFLGGICGIHAAFAGEALKGPELCAAEYSEDMQLAYLFIKFPCSENVGKQVLNAAGAKLTADGHLEYAQFYFNHLKLQELVQLFVILQELSVSKDYLLAPLVFDVKDAIIRRGYADEDAREFFFNAIDNSTEHNRHLKRILAELQDGCHDFYPLIDASGAPFKSLDSAAFEPSKSPSSQRAQGDKVVVFQAAYESPNIKVGGLGSFVTDFSASLKRYEALDLHFISPYCDFLKREHPYPVFRGFVDHQVYGKVMRSSIYEIEINGGIKQYLIKTDPQMARIFDIGKSQNIYKPFEHAEYSPRMAYFNAAVAMLAATFRGEEGRQSVDILHLHTWHTALAASLLDIKLNPLRESYGIGKVRVLNTVHMHGPEQGIMTAKIFNKVGLDLPQGRQKAATLIQNNIYERPSMARPRPRVLKDMAKNETAFVDAKADPYVMSRAAYSGSEILLDDSGDELEVINLLVETAPSTTPAP